MKKLHFVLLLTGAVALASCGGKTPPPAPTWSVCTGIENYPALLEAGYDYIEPSVANLLMPAQSDSAFLMHREFVRSLDPKIISCTIFLPGQFRAVGPEANHDDILEWAETTFSRARELDVPYIVFGSGRSRRVPDGFSREEAKNQFIALCKRLGPAAAKYGVTVVVEPLNTGETNFINSLAEGAEIVEATDHPNVRLLCDIFHMLREDEPASEIVKYGSYIRHCHIAEKGNRTAPGMEPYDFTAYFDALKEIRYAGCISIEGSWGEGGMASGLVAALEYMKGQYGVE